MLAIEEMKKKDYSEALKYITAARQWPENLGVGKPYESDIDERLEDWLAYQNYLKLNNEQAAQQMLTKILSVMPSNDNENISSSSNNLVSAWALQKTGKAEQAEKFLQGWLNKSPNNPLAHWAMNIYKGEEFNLPEGKRTDTDYKIIQQWIAMQ